MFRRAVLMLALVGVMVVPPVVAPSPSAAATKTVVVTDEEFHPAQVQAQPGDEVRWVVGEGVHSVRADDGSWAAADFMGEGSEFARTFALPGVYAYHCTIHGAPGGGGMSGVVAVVAASTTTTTPPTMTTTTTTQTSATTTTTSPVATTTTTLPTTAPTYIVRPGPAVAVVSSYVYTTPGSSYHHAVGEVINTGNVNLFLVEVVLDLYDSSNRLLATESAYADVWILAPGERAGFDVMFSPPPGWTTQALNASGEPTSRHPNHNFSVAVTNRYTDSADYEHLVGQVTNLNDTTAGFVSVYGTFYDEHGFPAGQQETFVNGSGSDLAPGQAGSFEFIRIPGEKPWSAWFIFAESTTDPSPPPANSSPKGQERQLPTPSVPTPDPVPSGAGGPGYWMMGADGRVDAFGEARHLGHPQGVLPGGAAAVDIEPTPSAAGYWILDDGGTIRLYGNAEYYGEVAARVLAAGEKVTSLSATPSGAGYWIFTSQGRVFAYGDARSFGDMTGVVLNGPVLDAVATPSGQGYWMVASEGGIFSFGDARFSGSMGGQPLNQPVMSMAPDPDGVGYWLVASDGGIFAFDAGFHGSLGSLQLNKPVSGMVPGRAGYLMVAEDGGIFAFGDAAFHGSLGANPPPAPVVAVALMP